MDHLLKLLRMFRGCTMHKVLVGPAGIHLDFLSPEFPFQVMEILCCGKLVFVDKDSQRFLLMQGSDYIDGATSESLPLHSVVDGTDFDAEKNAILLSLGSTGKLLLQYRSDCDEPEIFINVWEGLPHNSRRIDSTRLPIGEP